MVVMTERPKWSDERLDDLSNRVDHLGRRMEAGFAELRAEMNTRFDAQEARFDRMQQTMIIIGAGLIGTLIAALASAIVAAILLS
jgi:phosphoglycerate dehydrogenase-like enzyme